MWEVDGVAVLNRMNDLIDIARVDGTVRITALISTTSPSIPLPCVAASAWCSRSPTLPEVDLRQCCVRPVAGSGERRRRRALTPQCRLWDEVKDRLGSPLGMSGDSSSGSASPGHCREPRRSAHGRAVLALDPIATA